ncbi:MAG TPA: hypothetical protein EYN25_02650, partial [Candidatus Nitrosopelagicus sp.]|nr:hypothetical protein [Candidatus Nitrosopelagicus sp.]
MDSESNKSDAEEILSEFQKTHGIEPTVEPQVEADESVTIRAPTLQLSKISTLREDSVDYVFLEKSLL